jgi:RNA polymerase sigma-70 factor (ECF subfamily)
LDVALRQEFTRLHDDVDLERDRVLVERCQAGDSGAFGSLYARYYERLLRFCLRRLHDHHEAEDAAQEAFAKAWKALPNFGGDRHFYPWLTVIAGNVCTDILRRRSRSTPTADTELSARLPVGAAGNATADEMVIAGVDGELVHKALDRLSSRHRDVLAMREESGWTYQQIADHEGVEIGTIETLLWRARQALKREFNVLAESKGALGGFLAGAGALVRTGWARTAHRGASLAAGGSGSGSMRNAFAGVAVTSAAVAAAFMAPHALDPGSAGRVALPAPTSTQTLGANAARSSLTPEAASTVGPGGSSVGGAPPSTSASASANAGAGGGAGGITVPTTGAVGGLLPAGGSPLNPVTALSGVTQPIGNLLGPIASGASGALAQSPVGAVVSSTTNGLSSAVSGLGTTVNGLGAAAVNGLGQTVGSALTSLAGAPATAATTTTLPPLPSIVAPLTNTVTSTVQNLLGQG